MAVIVVIVVGLAAAACANALYSRRNREDSLEKHERALNALRELAEHPQPEPEPLHTELPTDHVKILDERPEGTSPQRRRTRRAASARRASARTRPRGIADRPTAAQLPRTPSSSRLTPPVVPPSKSPTPSPPEPVEIPAAASAPEPETPEPPRIAVPVVPIVFDDEIGEPEPHPTFAPLPSRRAGFPAVPRSVAVAAAAALIAVLIASVTAFVVADNSSGGPKRAAPPRAVVATTTTPPPTVTTTVPKPTAEFTASAAGNGTVTVTVPFTLTLSANGACWVGVEDATGKVVFSRTLQSGEQQQVPGDGPLTVRLGNSKAIEMSVNGTPLNLAGVANTANVQFQPPT